MLLFPYDIMIMARLPANVAFLASQFELTLGLPLLVWAWSRMSSWSRLAVWIISLTSATCLCFPSTCNSVLSSKCLEAYLIICWTTSCLQRCLAQTNRDHRSDSFSGAVKVIPDDQKGFLFASSNCVVATWLLLPTDWPQALIQSPILREYPWDAM